MSWIKTFSGRKMDFLNPDPDNIILMDICIALSRNHRFGGHSPVKVAQHLLEVLNLMLREAEEKELTFSKKELAEIALVALIHDFPEYVVGDIPTPLKRLLGSGFDEIEARILQVMLVKWDLVEAYAKWNTLLKWADAEAVQQEAIRFKLDGWIMSEDLDHQQTPHEWTPADREINLVNGTFSEEALQPLLTTVFIRYMVLSGRFELLTPFWQSHVTEMVEESGRTMLDVVSESAMNVSLFVDHPGYL